MTVDDVLEEMTPVVADYLNQQPEQGRRCTPTISKQALRSICSQPFATGPGWAPLHSWLQRAGSNRSREIPGAWYRRIHEELTKMSQPEE